MKSIPKFNPKALSNFHNDWKTYIKKHERPAADLWIHNLNLLRKHEFNSRHMNRLLKLVFNQTLEKDYAPGIRLAMLYEYSPKHQDAINMIGPILKWDASAEDELNFLCWDRDPKKIETFYPKRAYGYLLNVMECALTAEEDENYYKNLVFLLPVVCNHMLQSLSEEKNIPTLEDTYARIIGNISDNLEPVIEQLDNQTCFELLFVLNAIVTNINEQNPNKAPISELRQDEYKTGSKQIQTSWITRYPEAAREYAKLKSLGADSFSIWINFQTKSETELLPTPDF